ncbi:MAG: hypothetical protein M1827_003549 [Pycnora praestabilis]|nr:MAG: hypothetical protein M1827_003549 [Pycnora praestabilis]
MGSDPLSPIAPARVKALLLPLGKIKRARFSGFVERLRPENVVRLGDVSPDRRPNRTMFSPLAFPTGTILYDFTTSIFPSSQTTLSPFELFRDPLTIVGIADSTEIGNRLAVDGAQVNGNEDNGEDGPALKERDIRLLMEEMEDVREKYPKALVHQIVLFDYAQDEMGMSIPEGIITVPNPKLSKTTTMKTVSCDLTSLLLAEMTTFARSLQGLPSVDSPSSSGGGRLLNGDSSWPHEPLGHLSRRNSQLAAQSHNSRSASPADMDASHHRMSMPAQLPSSSSSYSASIAGPRPTSARGRAQTPPPTTFDEITGAAEAPNGSPISNTVSRSSAGGFARDSSRDRISVQGFGSGSLSERARNKGKGRIGMVVGTLYLHAGRWGDAVRELTESAFTAKANSDHLWHAKALENILICLLMFGWAGMDFQIPQICYPVADKASSSSVKSPQHTPSSSTADLHSGRGPIATNRLISLQNLTNLLSDLLNTILNLYTRAANFIGEALPQIAFSESVIRFSKLLAIVHLNGGKLDDYVLQYVVQNVPIPTIPRLDSPRFTILPKRTEIISVLFRAFPVPSPNTTPSVIDHTIILAGIASVLSSLGFHRKKALVMKELVSYLIPGLVQARKVGAAEMGVHPAAGLAALNAASGNSAGAGALDLGHGDVESGIGELLAVLGRVYGVVGTKPVSAEAAMTGLGAPENDVEDHSPSRKARDESNEAIIVRIVENSTIRCFGSRNLKMDVLRSCINFCEALPDFQGVLRFTSELLQTAGSGIAPGIDSSNGSASIAREEQIRLATNISRTVGAAKKLGLQDIEAEYWDEFLIRGVEIIEPASWRTPIPHARGELEDAGAIEEKKEKSPFIYNPFLKKPEAAVFEPLLVAGEQADFCVTLQNPYDFDIEIEWLRLESSGANFESMQKGIELGSYRTQTLLVSGMPRSRGRLSITGCIVKVRGCNERRFPIFSDPWSPISVTKIKHFGLAASNPSNTRPMSAASTAKSSMPASAPQASSLALKVISEQPVVIVKSTSLSQSAIMALEGELKVFTITLENTSSSTPVDLLLFSFKDSTTAPMQAAMSNKELIPTELYELELLFSRKQAFRLRRKDDAKPPYIGPGESKTFEIEILGKPGLTSGVIQVDYTHLAVPRAEVKNEFYTRQVIIPITVTVNASVELVRVDLLPFTRDFAWSNKHQRDLANGSPEGQPDHRRTRTSSRAIKGDNRFQSLLERLGLGLHDSEHCLLLLDLRNAWPQPLSISLQVRENRSNGETFEDTWRRAYTSHEVLQPGHTSRIILLLPRIHLRNPHAPIPNLNPATQRQFVVSASRVSPEVERATREAFWFREEVLNHIRGTWEEDGTSRTGDIELRGIRLSPRMIDAVKVEDLGIEMFIVASEPKVEKEDLVHQTGRSKFEVTTEEFLTLKTKIHNRTQQPIYPLLRLQPSLRNQPHNIALDLSKRFAWGGLLQRPLPLLRPGETTEVEIAFCVLCRGEFEINASIEEIRLWKPPRSDSTSPTQGGRPRADTNVLLGDALGERKERRVWHAREGCQILAKDREMGG